MRLLVLPSALFLTLALDACRDARQSATRGSARPTAEFIVAAGDSAYWVASDTAGLRVRGAPLELARVDGQFVEVYVVDDERSFGEADLVGQSVYKRDLRSGASVRVFTDSIVPDIAPQYARAHPDAQPPPRCNQPSDNTRLRGPARWAGCAPALVRAATSGGVAHGRWPPPPASTRAASPSPLPEADLPSRTPFPAPARATPVTCCRSRPYHSPSRNGGATSLRHFR